MIEMDELVICYPLQGYGRAGTIHRGTCGTIASRYGMRSDGTIYRGAHLYHWNPETDAQQYIDLSALQTGTPWPTGQAAGAGCVQPAPSNHQDHR